ncbi:remorin-like [Tasmannia lanceolata]|uniref:remorin-like n=1 Tax=Tasmannia lanceolata TaxID=3420 RepID=UPI004064AC59
MGEEEPKKVEELEATPPPPAPKYMAEEKTVIPSPEHKVDDSKALTLVDKVSDPPAVEKHSGGSIDRDAVLARVEVEKRMSLIKAWEESEKTKADNKSEKNLSSIVSWENTKKAAVEAQLRQIEEKLEKKKAEYAEKMKNKICIIHKVAEEKRAMVEAKHGEERLLAEEAAAKYRATGHTPKKLLGCFGG